MRNIPAAGLFAAGAVCAAAAAFCDLPWWGVLAAVWIPLGMGAWQLPSLHFAVLALGLAAGSCGGFFSAYHPRNGLGAQLRPGGMYGGAEVRVIDRTLPRLSYEAPGTAILAELETFRPEGECTAATRGVVQLRLSAHHPRPGYGDRLRITGRFAPGTPGEGLFDYPNYLRQRGIDATVWADSCENLGTRRDWFSPILRIRDALLERAWRNVETPELRATVARLFFGCRPEPDGATRARLVYAGMIHLYCVSGLHVAMLAGLLLALTLPLPDRMRYLLMLTVAGLYVLSVGAGVAAVRAWILLAALSLGRLFFRTEPPLRILLFTGAATTAFNPYNLGDPGFWYSYLITAMLLALPLPLRELRRRTGELAVWRGYDEEFLTFRHKILIAMLTCAAAFLAGAMVSLYFQGWLLPGSIAANFCTLPLVGVLFPLLGFKLLFPGYAELLNGALRLLDGVAEAVATGFPPVPAMRPAWWATVIFYVGLFACLCGKTRRTRIAGGIAAGAVFGGCLLWPFVRPPLRAVGVDEGVVFAVRSDPGTGETAVWNVPGPRAASAIRRLLAEAGVTEIDRLCFTGGTAGYLRGAAALAAGMPVRQVEPPVKFRSAAAKKCFAQLLQNSPGIRCAARRGDTPELPEELPGFARFPETGAGIRLKPINRMEIRKLESK